MRKKIMEQISENVDLTGVPSKSTIYYGSNRPGWMIRFEIRKRVEELGPTWTESKLLLQCYRDACIREGWETVVPDQNP